MENKVSIKNVFNQSMLHLKANWQKAFLASILQFGVFLLVFLLTNSSLIALVGWLLFLPLQTAFLSNMADEKVHLEHIFKIGSHWLTYLLLAVVCVICYTVGFALAIVPAILLFVNYAFVFDFAKENDLLSSFKKSKELAKGYRPKLLAISLIYLFILLVLVAVGILIALLVGLCLHTNHYMLYVWGTFAGLCLFLIFASPVMSLTISYFKKAVEQDKQQKEQEKADSELQNAEHNSNEDAEQTFANSTQVQKNNQDDQTTNDTDEDDPTSLIV